MVIVDDDLSHNQHVASTIRWYNWDGYGKHRKICLWGTFRDSGHVYNSSEMLALSGYLVTRPEKIFWTRITRQTFFSKLICGIAVGFQPLLGRDMENLRFWNVSPLLGSEDWARNTVRMPKADHAKNPRKDSAQTYGNIWRQPLAKNLLMKKIFRPVWRGPMKPHKLSKSKS